MKNTIKLILTLSIGVIVFGCNDSGVIHKKNVQLIDKYVQAVEDLDYETMASCLDESYVGLGPSYNDSINKTEAVANWKESVDNLYESITYNKSKTIAVTIKTGDNPGEWVSNWAELNIKYKAGKGEVTVWANSIYKIENEKIVRSFTFYNEADVLEQLGYVFINLNKI